MDQALSSLRAGLAATLAAAAPILAAEPVPEEAIVITGTRESLRTALARKRAATGILDSVHADEIGKLPDLAVADALQRVTGVQITRDRGEGSGIAVRGLTQVTTTVNGREVFTAGSGRTLDFADVAAEAVAAIDVHKSAAADRIEGGLAGTIDLRTWRPFDFAAGAAVVSLRAMHADPAQRSAGQASALFARRLRLDDGGELGLLLNLALQHRVWREDQKSSGNLLVRSDLVPGVAVVAPNGTSETVSVGTRRRQAASAMLQWRPSPQAELHLEAHLAELRTRQDSHQINVTAGTGFVAESVSLFPDTTDLRSITWTDAPLSVLSFARDTLDRTRQLAAGARWSAAEVTVSGDLSFTDSLNRLYFSGPFFAGRAARFTQDLAGAVPATGIEGTDLLDPASLAYTGLAYRTRPFAGDLLAGRLDAQWPGRGDTVERWAIGWRFARRRADNTPGLIFADAPLSGLGTADTPGRVMPMPNDGLLGARAPNIENFLVGNLDGARDAVNYRESFGITQPIPAAGDPLGLWTVRESTQALYALLAAAPPGLALGVEAGLRIVGTEVAVRGAQTVAGSGTVQPIAMDSRYVDVLPSMALRWRLDGEWLLRAAASRTLTRVDFDLLSPSLNLVPNPVNPALNQGGAGNPALRPVRATGVDFAIEQHAAAGQAATLTLFWKRVDGFVARASQPEVHGGAVYQVSRPYNSNPATVRGAEAAWQRFFDFLPGAWRGLGVLANATYVDSRTPDSRLNAQVPLQNLSRTSGNLVLLYEFGPLSARVAYNRRSSYLSGVSSFAGVGTLAATTQGYGWLDASVVWRIDAGMTLALEGSNLTDTLRRSYYGVPTRPQSAIGNDRQLALRGSFAF